MNAALGLSELGLMLRRPWGHTRCNQVPFPTKLACSLESWSKVGLGGPWKVHGLVRVTLWGFWCWLCVFPVQSVQRLS